MNGINRAKSLKEAKQILREDYGYSDYEIKTLFDDNMLMTMVDSLSYRDASRELSIDIESLSLSQEGESKMNIVINHIKKGVNINKSFMRYYHIINGNIFFIGREVIYDGRRYVIVFSHESTSYLTDNSRFIEVDHSEIKIINEKILFDKVKELFEIVYDLIRDKMSIVSYIEIFSHIYDIDIPSMIGSMREDMRDKVIKHLTPHMEERNLDISSVINI